jgi:hypothetical protein
MLSFQSTVLLEAMIKKTNYEHAFLISSSLKNEIIFEHGFLLSSSLKNETSCEDSFHVSVATSLKNEIEPMRIVFASLWKPR